MKKLYFLLIAMISVSSIFAQERNWNNRQENKQDVYHRDTRSSTYQQPDNRYGNGRSNNDDRYYGKQQQMQERDRRAAIERINRDYDQRINNYRNDRAMNRYERDRRIAQAQRERQQQVSSFGKGAIAGAIVGIIAGVILSN